MPTLTRKNWPLGWTPCDNEINGRVEGLLRADNLTQDENGIWRLIRGTKKVSSGPLYDVGIPGSYTNTIYSRYLNGKKLRYVSYSGKVLRNYSNVIGGYNTLIDFDSVVLSGAGDPTYSCFGTGFGHNFIISGPEKKKDNGLNKDNLGVIHHSFNLGIAAPTPPGLVLENSYTVDVSGKDSGKFTLWDTAPVEGVAASYVKSGDYVLIVADPTTFRAIAQRGLDTALTLDANTLTRVAETIKGHDSDIFKYNIRVSDTSKFIKVRVEYLLEAPTTAGLTEDITNYYWKEWIFEQSGSLTDTSGIGFDPLDSDRIPKKVTPEELDRLRNLIERGRAFSETGYKQTFRQGIDVWSTLSCERKDFTREGSDQSKDWGIVKGIRVIFTGLAQLTYVFNDLTFEGGPLTGHFTYKQVNVYKNDNYKEFGIPSDDSGEVTVINAGVQVDCTIPPANDQVNEIWLYRRSEFTGGFYRVAIITTVTAGTHFHDTISDAELLQINEQLPAYATALPDYIYDMVCDYFNRNLYMTAKEVISSYKDNPGLYDSRFLLNISGDQAEVNLFMKKVSNSSILIGTTKDIYELTGDGSEVEISEGVLILNYQLRALGIECPPVCNASCVHDGALIYLSHDGWHSLQGSSNIVISQDLSLLYLKEARHGINEVLMPIANSSVVMCVVAKNKFWACVDHVTDGRALHVYNFKTKTWEYRHFGTYGQNPLAIFVEEDGTILYSTPSAGDKYLREYDVGTLFDESSFIDFTLRTVYDDNGQPRNRKDLYTLRIGLDTGNTNITITVRAIDDNSTVYSKTYTELGNGYTVLNKVINDYISTPIKKIQVEISGTVSLFKLYEFFIDYDARPEQLNFLILKPEDFGVSGRKRIPDLSLIIDTLGLNVNFTPTIDGVSKITSIINKSVKDIHHHYFLTDEVGYMIGGVLSGNLFEFYKLIQPRNIEVLPDPTKYKITNTSNLGTTTRKRIIQYARMIDTISSNVVMTPYIDGVAYPPLTFNSNRKKTHIYPFATDVIGVDIACLLTGAAEFEDYGESLEDCVFEKLPAVTKVKFSNYSNLGSTSRKRIVQYARVVDTLGHDVDLIPYVDGVAYTPKIINSNRKQTHIYTFTFNVEGIEVACLLSGKYEFEDYGENLEECVTEKLPRSTKYVNLSTTNFGIANKKRIRTIPFVINTRNGSVLYTPSVDGVLFSPKYLTSVEKRTLLYTFNQDSFGIDYGGVLESSEEFEFYEMLKPEVVQILPVGKVFDQLGPIEYNKIGKLRELRLRIVPEGSSIAYEVFSADSSIHTGILTVIPNVEDVYVIKFPRGINPTICRVTLLSSSLFYRLSAVFKVHIEGKTTEFRYINENGKDV